MKFKTLPPREFLEECFIVDFNTGVLSWKERPSHHFRSQSAAKTFNTRNSGKRVGTVNGCGYEVFTVTYEGRVVSLLNHRVIVYLSGQEVLDKLVGHINGDRLDNRLCNLRVCTSSQNVGNMLKVKRDGLQGAFYMKDRGYWKSCIKIKGKTVNLGTFDTEEDAHKAYVKAREERFANGL